MRHYVPKLSEYPNWIGPVVKTVNALIVWLKCWSHSLPMPENTGFTKSLPTSSYKASLCDDFENQFRNYRMFRGENWSEFQLQPMISLTVYKLTFKVLVGFLLLKSSRLLVNSIQKYFLLSSFLNSLKCHLRDATSMQMELFVWGLYWATH